MRPRHRRPARRRPTGARSPRRSPTPSASTQRPIVWTEGGDPEKIVEARGMKQVTDTGAIEKAVDEIIAANPDKVAQAQAKPTMLGWFVGQVMKGTGGKANPQAVNEILKSKLGI